MGNLTVSKQLEIAEKESKHTKGVQFYCSVRHELIFIPNVKAQGFSNNNIKRNESNTENS
jgi:hypothetical protein